MNFSSAVAPQTPIICINKKNTWSFLHLARPRDQKEHFAAELNICANAVRLPFICLNANVVCG